MQGRAFAVVLAIVLLISSPLCIYAAEAQKPIGRITASFGQTALEATGAKSRPGDLYSAVNNEDRVVTDGGGVSILLASRVVLKMDAESAIRISEQPGQTMIVLEHGTVHVYVGQRPAQDAIVTLADANTRIEAKQGVFLASYSDKAKEGYYACEHGSVALTALNDNKKVTLAADKQIVVKNHQSSDVVDLDRVTFDQCKQYLERLDQITVAQGADTFRMRSRTLDTQSAISQLAAAGWIDKAALARNTQAAAAANTEENSSANSTDTGTGGKKDAKGGNTSTLSAGNNTNSSNTNTSSNSQPKSDPVASTPAVSGDAGAPPAQNLPTVDVARNDNGANAPPPVDLGKNDKGPKDKGAKDGQTASFTTPPGVTVPPVSTPPSVDISGVPQGTPVVNAPPVVDTAPPVNVVDVPPVNTPVANVPPIDIEGPGKNNGKGHGKGGDTITLSAPPVNVAPPPVNIADVPSVNTVPVMTPPPVDLTPVPNTPPPVDVAALPPVSMPDIGKGDKGGKGKGAAPSVDVAPTPTPTPASVPPVSVVAPPPVAVAPPAPVTPPAPPIDLPKVDVPVVPPVASVPPPVNVSDVTSGKGAPTPPVASVPPPIDLPPVNVPVVAPTPTPTNVVPTDTPGTGTDTTPVAAPAPTPTPVATPDVTPPPTNVIPTPTDVVTPDAGATATPPPVVTSDNSDKTSKSGKKKKGRH